MNRRPDPAPSRLTYRVQRLALTPSVRRLFTLGMPAFALVLIGTLTFSDSGRRAAVGAWAEETLSQFRQREAFMVRLMEIEGASPEVGAAIRAAAGLSFPISSFELELGATRDRIAALDAVERADLSVRPGGVLEVNVVERVPRLVRRGADGLALLDGTGQRVAALETRAARADLPLIGGAGAATAAAEALALFEAAAPVSRRIRGLMRIGERRWDLVLDGGQRILLPEADPRVALVRAMSIHAETALLDRDVAALDMRLPDRPTARLPEDAAHELRRAKLTELGTN